MPGFESRYPIAVSQTALGWLVTHTVAFVSAVTGKTYKIRGDKSTTDFASMPGWFLWLFRPWNVIDPTIPPAVLHDEFWRVKVPAGEMTYREADRVFREALICQGNDLFTSWGMWAGVRLGALSRGREGRRGCGGTPCRSCSSASDCSSSPRRRSSSSRRWPWCGF